MSLRGANIQRGKTGASIGGGQTGTSALLATGLAVADGLQYGVAYELYNPEDAEKLGINRDYDNNQNLRIFRHVEEFYRKAGKGTKLVLLVAPQATTMSELINYEGTFSPKVITKAKGEIRQVAVSINPADGYTSVMLDGMNSEVSAAISTAQAFADWCFETHRPVHVLLEGRDYGGDASVAVDLRNIPNLAATDVSIVIGQDYNYADSLNPIGTRFADVGTALGDVSALRVNQCIGAVGSTNLTDAKKGKWLAAGLSSHQNIDDVESDLTTLDAKGYIFGCEYTGIAGFRWNDDHVCAPVIEDVEGNLNESSIAYSRTLKEATRVLRTALLPTIKEEKPVDPITGLLPIGVIRYFEGIGDKALGSMSNVLSGFKTIVDPQSDLLSGDRALDVSFNITPFGIIGEINGKLNLKRSL